MIFFLIDIGNTNTRYGVWDESERILDAASIPTDDLTADIVPDGEFRVFIASVVPGAADVFERFSPFFVTVESAGFIDFSSIDSSTLGADRIANAAALAKFSELPAICVDCGTAVTIEGVDGDRRFYSGPIAPGRVLMRSALNAHTAQLPAVNLNRETSSPPIFSCTTKGAILAGCDLGAVEMVRGLIEKAREWPGFSDCGVYLAGGDSDYFAANIPEAENVGADFTLLGIAGIFKENCE